MINHIFSLHLVHMVYQQFVKIYVLVNICQVLKILYFFVLYFPHHRFYQFDAVLTQQIYNVNVQQTNNLVVNDVINLHTVCFQVYSQIHHP